MTSSHGSLDALAQKKTSRAIPESLHEDVLDREPPLPSIIALRVALLAARLGSFSRVADELNMTQSGVSRSIAGLEQLAGRRLFVRSRGGVTPTRAGERYLASVRSILSRLGAATMRVRSEGDDARRLHVATLPSFGSLWLAPKLVGFLKRNPGISIDVTASIGAFDFANSAVDCVIHYGTDVWPDGSRSELLMQERLLPYASPEALKAAKVPAEVEALQSLTLIHHSHRPSAWRDWFSEVGGDYPEASQFVRFEQYQMGIQAAVFGLGAILMPPMLVQAQVAQGQLVPLHDMPVLSQWRYYLVSPEAARDSETFARFRSWILKIAKQEAAI